MGRIQEGLADLRLASEMLRTAGGTDFSVFVRGTDPRKAFREAVEDARHEHGHGGYSGSIAEKSDFKLRSSTPMTRDEAHAFIDKDIERNEKWGPAFAVPIAEGKVLRESTKTVKVQAKSATFAAEEARKLLTSQARAGSTVEVAVEHGSIKALKAGSPPKVEKSKGTTSYWTFGLSYDRPSDWAPDRGGRFKDRAGAMAALKEILAVKPGREPPSKGAHYTIWKVQQTDVVKVVEEPSRLASWEVTAKVREVQKGTVVGFLFYGIASS